MVDHRPDCAYGKSDSEDQCGNGHNPVRNLHAAVTQQTDQHQCGNGQQRFAKVNLIAENCVVEPELEQFAQEEPREQRQRGYIGPQNRDIGQQDKPGCQEAHVSAAYLPFERVQPARPGGFAYHILQVPGDHKDHRHSSQQTQYGSQDARLLKVGIACNDKGSPADAGSNRKGPHTQRTESRSESLCAALMTRVQLLHLLTKRKKYV